MASTACYHPRVRTLCARCDARLRAIVVAERALARRPRADAPARVRAGSGVTWFGRRLAVVQDDGRALVLVDPDGGRTARLALVPGGVAAVDSKRTKLDFEACAGATVDGEELLFVFGSGSRPRRRVVAVVRNPQRPRVSLYDAATFYDRLAADAGFSGSRLNLEGAVSLGRRLVLANRANRRPGSVNALVEVPVGGLLAHLEYAAPLPPLHAVRRFDLGELKGWRIGFTDLARVAGGRLLYSGAAENTRDAGRDGRIAGSVIGVLGPRGVRWAPLIGMDGEPFVAKVEGLCARGRGFRNLWAVTDADDVREPARLCAIRLLGPW